MSRYDPKNYSLENALSNIGASFWARFCNDLKAYAANRTRVDIVQKIHDEWESSSGLSSSGTNIRIEWACAIYDHNDWDKAAGIREIPIETPAAPISIDFRRNYPAEYRCDNGLYVRSLSELCIANWLYSNHITFEYERQVTFANSGATAYCDFYLLKKNIYIEFWGMPDNPSYSSYMKRKQQLYTQNNLNLVSLYPEDLKNLRDRLIKAISELS